MYKRQHKGNCKAFSEIVVQIEADENVKFSCDYKVEFRVLQATLKGCREQMRELCQIFSPKETTNHRCGGNEHKLPNSNSMKDKIERAVNTDIQVK